jgi:hypothetical protein
MDVDVLQNWYTVPYWPLEAICLLHRPSVNARDKIMARPGNMCDSYIRRSQMVCRPIVFIQQWVNKLINYKYTSNHLVYFPSVIYTTQCAR